MNAQLDAAERAHVERARELKAEILKLECDSANLVRFLAGGESFSVRTELQSIEAALQRLRFELAELKHQAGVRLPRASPGWIRWRLEHLDALLREYAPRARLEILKQNIANAKRRAAAIAVGIPVMVTSFASEPD